ncbi:excision controlling factor protein, XisH like protein (plasmid) [Picosynechococcus sp. PCC 7002]|uniref:XisH family protein n=1 Tax=Picosynechococcus sp. (strain ATCC 27264 / PCC 7002 / PR-6) TaxID=32049 RepID=UPI00016DCEA2|nr:XisH family protein [Picosynechococcus sp. PCC 7002]ACB00956.1 excision controlling factor protein, XisH like protein [Picosynechococcus sp. PCC 7002]
MAAKDKFHEAVKTALIKENWTITHNPLNLKFGEYDQVQIDLGAEQVLGAEKDNQKIAVEIKSFLNDSALSDFHLALGLGQFLNYRLVLETTEPNRTLFLAVPLYAYQSFFKRDLPKAAIKQYQLNLIVYDPIKEMLVEWIN